MATTTLDPLAGVDFTALDSVPQFVLGTEKTDSNGTTWCYVKASSSGQTAYLAYPISNAFVMNATGMVYAATAMVTLLGVPQQAMTANLWGWVAIRGPMTIATAGAVTALVKCYTTTSTNGKIDDTSASQNEIPGLYVITDPGAAGNASCFAVDRLRRG